MSPAHLATILGVRAAQDRRHGEAAALFALTAYAPTNRMTERWWGRRHSYAARTQERLAADAGQTMPYAALTEGSVIVGDEEHRTEAPGLTGTIYVVLGSSKRAGTCAACGQPVEVASAHATGDDPETLWLRRAWPDEGSTGDRMGLAHARCVPSGLVLEIPKEL